MAPALLRYNEHVISLAMRQSGWMMGFLDTVSSAVGRGTAAAQRGTRSASLKLQLNDLMKQRRDLAAQLGASLYEATRAIPDYTQGREALYDGIASIDAKRAAIEAEIVQIEAAAAASQQASLSYKCPRCGTNVGGADMFCSGCGLPASEVRAAYTAAPAATEPAPGEQPAPEPQPASDAVAPEPQTGQPAEA